eukprot:TRINITY_DN31328_c0_g1_i1.p1 TRINITY_DN31328_c0_g1~~TRINITY_DN31328_c0_g1_i1.p1  ORF type:complete len:381 (+),score=86.02 TRINITY_DN31328_c0_g1_i1:74-1216(+)
MPLSLKPCLFVASLVGTSGFQTERGAINRAVAEADALQPDVAEPEKAAKYIQKPLKSEVSAHASKSASKHSSDSGKAPKFGDAECPCINIDGVKGGINLTIEGNSVPYPADLGASCKAWDDDVYPGCEKDGDPGKGNGFCGQEWCYVDPCNCNIGVTPKVSVVLPDGTYQGNAVYWSYATCGSEDKFTDNESVIMAPDFCGEEPSDDSAGSIGCKCIGVVTNVEGAIPVSIDGEAVNYPADVGHFCQAWDADTHPSCNSTDEEPEWCSQSWCYVDPCTCDTEAVLSGSSGYLPGATFQGRPLYYSYATCGSVDAWTGAENDEACVLKTSEDDCSSVSSCKWLGNATKGTPCVGKELAGMCSSALRAGASLLALCLAALSF